MRRSVIALLLVSAIGQASTVSAATPSRRRATKPPSSAVALPAPVATADSYSVDEGSTLTVAAPGVLANDTLNGASIASYGASTGAEETNSGRSTPTAAGGSLTLSGDGAFTYTPIGAFRGTDTFRYVIRSSGGSSTATATINVLAAQANAVTDSYSTAPDTGISIPAPGLLINDTLAGGRITGFGPRTGLEQSTIGGTAATNSGGSVSLSADGGFSYTPPPIQDDGYGYSRSFTGVDSFRYTIQSGSVVSAAGVNVTVDVQTGDANFTVTTPGHYYAISGLPGENPVLTLKRGTVYKIKISASGAHPFAILDAPPGNLVDNNITQGTLTFSVPSTAQNYRYRCTTHGFGNVIITEP